MLRPAHLSSPHGSLGIPGRAPWDPLLYGLAGGGLHSGPRVMGLVWSEADSPSPNSRICCEGGVGCTHSYCPQRGAGASGWPWHVVRPASDALVRRGADGQESGPESSLGAGASRGEEPFGCEMHSPARLEPRKAERWALERVGSAKRSTVSSCGPINGVGKGG